MRVSTVAEVDALVGRVCSAAELLKSRIAEADGDGLTLLRALKFEAIGFHPLEVRSLNAIEQINISWTWLAALAAAKQVFALHPGAGALLLAPGADFAQPLDVMSELEGMIGAEVFAAVRPRNNDKLAKDLAKLANRAEQYRYVFFASPDHAVTQRQPQFERYGVQVWSVRV
jgi:hypothetical protein